MPMPVSQLDRRLAPGLAEGDTEMRDASAHSLAASDAKQLSDRLGQMLSGSFASVIAWYDFYLYAVFALYLAKAFFPTGDARLLDTAGIFALGFLARPIGSWFLGIYADRHGRGAALTLSVLLMCLGCLIIAACPSYAEIGEWAPAALLAARLLQGGSLGGSYGSSGAYFSEVAPAPLRGLYSSFTFVTIILGQLLATLMLLALEQSLIDPQLQSWGWRVPYLIGAALAGSGLALRRGMGETKAFKAVATKPETGKPSPLRELLRHRREVVLAIGLTIGGTLAFYTFTVYMQQELVTTIGLPKSQAALVFCAALTLFMLLQPLFAWISDKIGRRPLLLWFGVLGALGTVPIMGALAETHDPWTAFLLVMAALVIVSGYTSTNVIVKAELFPASVRALGTGLPYAATVAVFGGSADWVALAFRQVGHASWFSWHVTACILVSLAVYVFMRETRDRSQFTG